jgi:hypothetical protein
VSRVGDLGIDDVAPKAYVDGPVIRNRRRKPLHPEQIQKLLREKTARKVAKRGPTPYGWLVFLFSSAGKIVRETRENATYEEAQELLAREKSWAGDCDAWIVAKQTPHQRTIRP